ncbi:MAG: tyrosine--tRNA ligase [Thermoplasmata archaeon]
MDAEARAERARRNTQETLTPEELRGLFETNEHPRAYIGFEPSGALTVAHLITARKMIDLQEAGCEVTVFLADWHALINDKLGGDLARIRASGRYMQAAFTALGVDASKAKFRWASDLVARSEYWERVIEVAKGTSLARTKRAMSIMGRQEEEASLDTSKLFYPSMQAADIFELPVEIAYGGMDQRRAHVLAREVAHQHHWPVPSAIHTPLLSSLQGGGRMDPTEGGVERKMSKSDPTSSIPIPSTPEVIAERLRAAYCPAKATEGNPIVEIAELILFPWTGAFEIDRAEKHGGPLRFATREEFRATWTAGGLHPQDLKTAVAKGLEPLLAPATRFFAAHPELGPSAFHASASDGTLK